MLYAQSKRWLTSLIVVTALAAIPVALSTGAAATDNNPPTTAVGEAAITAQIKAEMVRSDTLKAFDIEVDTEGGTVVLSGTVRTAAEKAEAERAARSVRGVTTVRNNIMIDPSN